MQSVQSASVSIEYRIIIAFKLREGNLKYTEVLVMRGKKSLLDSIT